MSTHSPKYVQHLRSPEWRSTRQQILERADYHCEHCGDAGFLEVHHLTYDRLGHERLDDLKALCEFCHKKADKERENKTQQRIWTARVEGWARKKYGSNWAWLHFDEIEEDFVRWLERRGECPPGCGCC